MIDKRIKIAPSILSADFSVMGEEVKDLEKNGADIIHVDVMDGVFVNNISFGMKMVKDIRKATSLPLDAHLMIIEPWKYVERFAEAGADIITVHYEACGEKLQETLELIKSTGKKCGLVINPDTPVDPVRSLIPACDMVLVMSVFPGMGGQKFIPYVLPKVVEIRKIIDESGKNIDLEIDGGVNLQNASIIKQSGVNVLVAGNTVFSAADRRGVIKALRES
ncbi:MAG: ribulose-phosphate 3-epimerase [Clostridia bacterium]|nr:ribulose-phosphate 3-epimerase [Clostridia bacterium]